VDRVAAIPLHDARAHLGDRCPSEVHASSARDGSIWRRDDTALWPTTSVTTHASSQVAPRSRSRVDLEGIVAEIAAIVKRYGCATIHGDRYAGQWVKRRSDGMRSPTPTPRLGSRASPSPHTSPRSDAALEAEPCSPRGHHAARSSQLIRELKNLERRPPPEAGRRSIIPGQRDDFATPCARAAMAGKDVRARWSSSPRFRGSASPPRTSRQPAPDAQRGRSRGAGALRHGLVSITLVSIRERKTVPCPRTRRDPNPTETRPAAQALQARRGSQWSEGPRCSRAVTMTNASRAARENQDDENRCGR